MIPWSRTAEPGVAGITTLRNALPGVTEANIHIDATIVVVGTNDAGRVTGTNCTSGLVLLPIASIRKIVWIWGHSDQVDVASGVPGISQVPLCQNRPVTINEASNKNPTTSTLFIFLTLLISFVPDHHAEQRSGIID